ncbi:NUDIX domain-containing protein [Streptomyces sp. NPDC051940]|uniref:NUDIX hydrolase n=1 Tax=Streptomyces sp. NPDC051940 TaxID=3155675 RepID=UPI003425C076
MPTSRARVAELVAGVSPCDELERTHRRSAADWIASGAPLYRTDPPDVPERHLVSYFVVVDDDRGELLLAAHRKAGLWLPPGGHVEPGEDPWTTVVRECREELGIPAVAHPLTGERPFFLTVTRTRGHGPHTDVSLWYVLTASAADVTAYTEEEFSAIRWLTPGQVLREPPETLDPHMHRFTRKLGDWCDVGHSRRVRGSSRATDG